MKPNSATHPGPAATPPLPAASPAKPPQQAAADAPTRVPLDDAVVTLLAELGQQIAALNAQRQGALVLFLRQNKLEGNWNIDPTGRELVRGD